MTFRKNPLPLSATAWTIFGCTAILPLVYVLARFIFGLIQQPSAITSILIDSRQLVLLGRSLMIALSATGVALVLGLPAAFILAAKDLPYRKLFYFLVLVPVLVPSYVMAGAWIHLLSPGGLINKILAGCFGPTATLSLFSTAGCAWCLGISFFPVIAIIVAAGLSQIDSNLVDIARLSTHRWGVFRYSVLPQILPHLLASVCLVMIFVLGRYGVPSLLGVNTYPVEIFAQFSAFYDDNGAIASALPLIVLVVFLVILQRRIMQSHDYVRITPSSETSNPITLNRIKHCGIWFLILLFIITTALPFISVLAYAHGLGNIWSTLCAYSSDIMTTSILALLAAVISTAIAFPIGEYLAHNHNRTARMLDIVCWLPIAIPGTILGLGLIKVGSRIPALQRADSFGVLLLLAYVGMFSAFSIRVCQASHKRSDPNVCEAAAIDCPRWYQRFLHVDIPVHSEAIAVSMIMVFVLVLGELNATVLLIPPGRATLSVSIDNLLHYGANATASALCLLEAGLVVFSIVCGLSVWAAAKRVLR